MATESIPPAILGYLTNNEYPESEQVSSSELSNATLSDLLQALHKEQEEAKSSIRELSVSAAPDIDSWISRAKELQADILRSRETARQIVAEAEAGRDLRSDVEEKSNKLSLLEKEVNFNETLTGTLERVKLVNSLLDRAQDQAVEADLECLGTLEEAEESIAALDGIAGSRAVDALRQRSLQLRDGIKESVAEFWTAYCSVNVEERWVQIHHPDYLMGSVPDNLPELKFEVIVNGAKALDTFDGLVQKLAKEIDRAVVRPRLTLSDEQLVANIQIEAQTLSCDGMSGDISHKALFEDVRRILDFLDKRLPKAVSTALSTQLMPLLFSRLENQWLDDAIPVAMKDVPDFQLLLEDVEQLARHVDSIGWSGSDRLSAWAHNAPRAWLTKRREAVLGDVRNLVFQGLRERKTVERVETRVVSKHDMGLEDAAAAGKNDDDEWDAAWDEPEESTPAAAPQQNPPADTNDDDDEASAWNIDEDDPLSKEDDAGANDEGDAWGWGDEDQKSASPRITAKQQKSASTTQPNGERNDQQELTLRETFLVTAIPDGILRILQQTITDAQTLAGPRYADSPLSPASAALYTIPTLALAIYRATAPTAYTKVDGLGSMLIYNDASRLADQLHAWQADQPAQSRLKVDNDVAALHSFAKRAYTSEMEAQRTILRDLLDGAQGFSGCSQQPMKQECESAVDDTISRLRDVAKMWAPILSSSAFLQSLGGLLNSVTTKVITDIQGLPDIGEADSTTLKELCDRVLSASDLFTGEEGRDMTFVYCPTWLKFQYLAEILVSSLADIRWMWTEGELSLEFAAEEVVELVEALFAESELRRTAVREIRRGR